MKKEPKALADFGEICEAIKEKFKNDYFPFEPFTEKEVTNVILELPTNKASLSDDIPISISKQSVHVQCTKLTSVMSNRLKKKNVSWYSQKCSNNSMPCHKKGNKG